MNEDLFCGRGWVRGWSPTLEIEKRDLDGKWST